MIAIFGGRLITVEGKEDQGLEVRHEQLQPHHHHLHHQHHHLLLLKPAFLSCSEINTLLHDLDESAEDVKPKSTTVTLVLFKIISDYF